MRSRRFTAAIESGLRLDGLAPPRVDDVQIQRVLANLLENAIKFSTRNGRASSRPIRGRDGRRRRDRRGRRRLPRAGLGLAIARGFAEVNDGGLSVEPRGARGTIAR